MGAASGEVRIGVALHPRAVFRIVIATAAGVLSGAAVAILGPWQVALLAGWDATGLVFAVWVWLAVSGLDASTTARIATREDPSRAAADGLLIVASVASLVGVGLVLVKAASAHDLGKLVLIASGIVSVVVSWATVHTVFMLRYARLFYSDHPGGIAFNDKDPPRYRDFAYVAFTVGMTFQVSDTAIQASTIRATVLRHALLSYLFGTVIVATTINAVAGLLK